MKKKNLQKIFICTIFMVFVFPCFTNIGVGMLPPPDGGGNPPPSPPPPPPSDYEWLILFYFSGEDETNNQDFIDTKNNILSIHSSEDVKMMMLFDFYYDDTYRYDFTDSGSDQLNVGEKNMGNKQTLIDFIDGAKESYPAEKIALVMDGHGSGIMSSGIEELGGLCYDANSNDDHITSSELHDAIYGKYINLLVMAPCVMAGIDFIYDIKDDVDIITASEEPTPIMGNLNYIKNAIVSLKNSYGEKTPEELGIMITNNYGIEYSDYNNPCVMATIKTSNLDILNLKLNNLFYRMIENICDYASYIEEDTSTVNNMAKFWINPGKPYVDLKAFLDAIDENYNNDITYNIQEVREVLNYPIIATSQSNSANLYTYCGLTIYFPRNEHQSSYNVLDYSPLYENMDWSIDFLWDDFLLAYYATLP